MAIWQRPFTPEALNQMSEGSMSNFLGIQYTRFGDDYLCATMPANERTRQPFGIIHGGANVVLAEGLASAAANLTLADPKQRAVGLDINANHIRMVREGIVTGTARPIHLGSSTQVWQIDITNEEGKLTCVCRMTAAIITPH